MSTASSKTILLAPWGNNNGHMAHCLALGAEAVRQGHRTIILYHEGSAHRQMIERTGCEALRYPAELQADNVWKCWHDNDFLTRSIQADALLLEREAIDIVVHDIRLSMPIAARLAGCACASICHQPLFAGFAYEQDGVSDLWLSGLDSFNAVLGRFGQPLLDSDIREILARDTILIGSIPELDPLTSQISPESAIYVGALSPTIWNERQSSAGAFEIQPSTGLLFYRTVGLRSDLASFSEVFLSKQTRVLIAAASNSTSDHLKTLMPSTAPDIAPLWDINALRGHDFVVIHHGGPGTILGCLAAGLPSLALPGHSPERIMYGSRLSGLGVGDSLPLAANYTTGWFDSVDESPDAPSWETVAKRVDAIRADANMAETVAEWSRTLQGLGPRYAIQALTERSVNPHPEGRPSSI